MTFDFQLRPVGGQRTFGPLFWIKYGSGTLFRNHELGQGKSFQSFKDQARSGAHLFQEVYRPTAEISQA